MAKGPKGERRPADANQRAVMVARIATGEIGDKVTDDCKNVAAVALGRMGGKARAASMTAKKRKEIAKKAAASRWKNRP
jgi:tartrate dehydratase beta subunit/fumarate hydratase class I family protein